MDIIGIVIGGSAKAHIFGYPTANIPLPDPTISGIYAARAQVDDSAYTAVVFADPVRNVLEAHLFDFSGNLYGKELKVELVEKIRDTERFDSDKALRAAMDEDARRARDILS